MERLRSNAAELADIFTARLGSSTSVKDHLQQAGCPTSLSDLGIDAHRLHPTLVKAHMIRQRYTILDVLYESGLFDSCVGGMTI
jgi:glycerol-1-phosphate dehydrogenase [NAD(P)+]